MKIIGHSEEIEKLNSIVTSEQISNAYIFCGPEGIGKFLVARKFAKDILKTTEGITVEPIEESIKVEPIRELREELMLKPIVSDRKIAIINNAELMTESAQNALLKILEEPPIYVTIILVTSNKEKLLPTIKSRCIDFKFNQLSDEEVKEYFNGEIDEELLKYGRGSIGRIVKAKEEGAQDIAKRWIKAIQKNSLIDIIKETNAIREEEFVKENITDFLEYILFLYSEELKTNKEFSTYAISVVEETRKNILRNANIDIALDRMIINLWRWREECKK